MSNREDDGMTLLKKWVLANETMLEKQRYFKVSLHGSEDDQHWHVTLESDNQIVGFGTGSTIEEAAREALSLPLALAAPESDVMGLRWMIGKHSQFSDGSVA